jgi:hypothetical protein
MIAISAEDCAAQAQEVALRKVQEGSHTPCTDELDGSGHENNAGLFKTSDKMGWRKIFLQVDRRSLNSPPF